MKPTKMYRQSSAKGDERDSTNFFWGGGFPFSFYCFLGRNFLNLGFRVGTFHERESTCGRGVGEAGGAQLWEPVSLNLKKKKKVVPMHEHGNRRSIKCALFVACGRLRASVRLPGARGKKVSEQGKKSGASR